MKPDHLKPDIKKKPPGPRLYYGRFLQEGKWRTRAGSRMTAEAAREGLIAEVRAFHNQCGVTTMQVTKKVGKDKHAEVVMEWEWEDIPMWSGS